MAFDLAGILVWVLFAALLACSILRRSQRQEAKRLGAELEREKERLQGMADQHPGLSPQWWREERARLEEPGE